MNRLAILWLAFITFHLCIAIPLCSAESEEQIKEYERYYDSELKKAESRIPVLVEQYATSLGCAFNMDPHNVVQYEIHGHKASFVALFSLDVGCTGGSQMSRPVFVVIRPGAHFKMVINAAYSTPGQTSDDFPSTVTNIFVKNGELWYEALDYDFSKDALCCPSVPITGKLVFEDGVWKGIPEKSMSPNTSLKGGGPDGPRRQLDRYADTANRRRLINSLLRPRT